jgi:hypothetical protein|tara:strand:- start:279 stop:431 length:153 start_codon:yes stop_codon:yes gene_type:complete
MDILCEPIEINKRFLSLVENDIIRQYEQLLHDIFKEIKQELYKESLKNIK